MRTIPIVDTTDPGVLVGRHSIWSSRLGIKIPFQFSGRITKYQHQEASYDPAETIPHELAILRALAAERMAPPVGDLVFVETIVSEHPGGWHCDPLGAYGYEVEDATTLPPGRFDLGAMKRLPIEGSPGAWSDIGVPGRDNVVNGYLVDVRRTAWDMLRWRGGDLPCLPAVAEREGELEQDVRRLCQFPAGQRPNPYQDFYLGGRWVRGERQVARRAQLLGFMPRPGETVLEIGCQSGGFLQFAHLAMGGAGVVLGVEVNEDYVGCGRRLARHAGQNICIRRMDAVAERAKLLSWVRSRAPRGVDHLLLLSMEKHLGEREMFALLDAVGARRSYVETNAVAPDDGTGSEAKGPMKLWPEVKARGGVHVGNSRDRNLRRLYRIEKR